MTKKELIREEPIKTKNPKTSKGKVNTGYLAIIKGPDIFLYETTYDNAYYAALEYLDNSNEYPILESIEICSVNRISKQTYNREERIFSQLELD